MLSTIKPYQTDSSVVTTERMEPPLRWEDISYKKIQMFDFYMQGLMCLLNFQVDILIRHFGLEIMKF